MKPVLVTGTAKDYLEIGLKYLSKPDGIIELVHEHNKQFSENPDRNVVLEEAYEVAKLVAQIVEGYGLERSEYYRQYEKLVEDAKLKIEVRNYPLDALTKRIQEIGIPKRIVKILERENYRWVYELVMSHKESCKGSPGMGVRSAAKLRECVQACGLDMLGEQSDVFLNRDFRFQAFLKKQRAA